MAMSDCIKCWQTPCCCGYDYRNWSADARLDLAAAVLGISEPVLKQVLTPYMLPQHPMCDNKK